MVAILSDSVKYRRQSYYADSLVLVVFYSKNRVILDSTHNTDDRAEN